MCVWRSKLERHLLATHSFLGRAPSIEKDFPSWWHGQVEAKSYMRLISLVWISFFRTMTRIDVFHCCNIQNCCLRTFIKIVSFTCWLLWLSRSYALRNECSTRKPMTRLSFHIDVKQIEGRYGVASRMAQMAQNYFSIRTWHNSYSPCARLDPFGALHGEALNWLLGSWSYNNAQPTSKDMIDNRWAVVRLPVQTPCHFFWASVKNG
jgi:hypothetical protein